MKIDFYTNNMLQMQGRIASVKEYSAGKAANINLAIDNGRDKDGNERAPIFIQLKSFTPASYNAVKVGMKVRVYGHIQPSRYEKNGETVYEQDLVADFVEFLESRAVVEEREERKARAV